jgi:predicted alpha/beta-fold hydrolase
MPILPKPNYNSSFWQFNGHIQTIYPSLLRKVPFQYQQRERLELPDGDFVDLDWTLVSPESRKLVIITHGLEGDSHRHYVLGMARLFSQEGFDILGWNCRSCSGEMNRLVRFYHHGDASDLRIVIDHAIHRYSYDEVVLIGYSMGGSLTLRVLGENPNWVPNQIKKAIAFSVPCDLLAGVKALSKGGNKMYANRFLSKLGVKIKQKEKLFPGQISYQGYEKIRHFIDFDNRYTAPLHGYSDAYDFYARASVKPLLKNIQVPSLLVQALNDPFLLEDCIGYDEAIANDSLFLETPDQGGHCGFMLPGNPFTWAELRALDFVVNNSWVH